MHAFRFWFAMSCVGLAAAACLTAAEAHTSGRGQPATAPSRTHPWIEGVDPALENRLFWNSYFLLPSHNVLKVYAFSAGGFESAGVRFSARVPHEQRDLRLAEMYDEAATLIRTAFDRFPELQTVDVWGTIPVAESEAKTDESTVFSVSADRALYERIRDSQLDSSQFVNQFGLVWVAPQVPQ